MFQAIISPAGFGPILDERRVAVYERISARIVAAIFDAAEAPFPRVDNANHEGSPS